MPNQSKNISYLVKINCHQTWSLSNTYYLHICNSHIAVVLYEVWTTLECQLLTKYYIYLLLSDIISSIIVLICVVFTLVDVVGVLYFWNITIDVISCCCIIVTVGLCVDYSAHIAHAFLVSSGKLKFQQI